jgi:lipopolysaccharide export system permease protein
MRIARTLSLYVMRETLLYCALAFFVLTLVLLTQNLLRRLDELFLVGMTLSDVAVVLDCIVPVALSYSIPLAFLVGILLAIRRLSADGELLALRASGIGPVGFLIPFLILGGLATILSGWILNSVEHESRRELVQLFKRVAARGAMIEPGKFRHIGQHLIFVEDRDRHGSLSGVMIYDQGDPSDLHSRANRVFAARGQFFFDEGTSQIQLDLQDGDVHFDPSDGEPTRYERIRFEELSYRLDVGHLVGMDFGPVRPKQMTVGELRAVIRRAENGDPLRELDQRDPVEYALEIHRRRALPLAPLLFAGIGVPIALFSEHRGRNLGMLIVLFASFSYYAFGALCEAAARGGWFGPGTAHWLPNLVFALLAVGLVRHCRRRIPG